MFRLLTLLLAACGASALVVTPRAPAVRAARAALASPCMQEDDARAVGTCKWFNVVKGFGFIEVDGDSPDVFVHQSDIYAPGFRSLAEGEPVEFKLAVDPNTGKSKAVEVTAERRVRAGRAEADDEYQSGRAGARPPPRARARRAQDAAPAGRGPRTSPHSRGGGGWWSCLGELVVCACARVRVPRRATRRLTSP